MTSPIYLADIVRSAVGAAFGEFARLDAPGMLPNIRLARLEAVDAVLVGGRAAVADARAKVIAEAVRATSSRQAAADLGLTLGAVSKACARARSVAW